MVRQKPIFYRRPLTAEEAQFASDHINLVYNYLYRRGLDPDEWFDVVVFHYLRTVKRYVSIPELRKYQFSTIAWQAMRSAVHDEYTKRDRRPKTVSFEDVIPGTENLTYGQILSGSETVESVLFAE